MYRNFICYRGGSSGGIFLSADIYKRCHEVESIIGKTYYSLIKEDSAEQRNFLNDPGAILGEVENFVMLLTRDFFDGFILNDKPNPESVTRIEIDEALKNKNMKFIPVLFSDFKWEGVTNGRVNQEIIAELWGEDAMRKIVGSPPIPFLVDYKNEAIERIVRELDQTGTLKIAEAAKFDGTFVIKSTPSVIPKSVFCGREEVLEKIKEIFESGERILFLQGIGGIGKTEIAKQYAKRNKDKYDTIIYATYNNSVVELFSSQASFKIEPIFPRHILIDGTQESDLSYFVRKLNLIKEITNERTLIIIDNFDVMDDEHFPDIVDAKYKLLITTRCDYSRLYPTIKIEPLESIEQLKSVFLQNYDGYMVDEDDEHLEELIELVNRHTYTIELIAQHMENSGQTVEEMIEVLKHEGIVSLNEEIRSTADRSQVAYQNLLKMFKVFNLDSDEKKVLQFLSLMPLSGVDVKDFRNWLDLKTFKLVKSLENRSWIFMSSNGLALHPIIREVVRYELPLSIEDAEPLFKAFIETIKEEKSWHFSISTKGYYADIAAEIIGIFNKIDEHTAELYRNIELLFSFSIRPARAIEIGKELYKYHKGVSGENSFICGYFAFQIGWTYLFNLLLPDALKQSEIWLEQSYKVLNAVPLSTENDFATYGHLLTHLSRVYLIAYIEDKDKAMLDKAIEYSLRAVENAETHFNSESPFYSRIAVAYMQLADAYIQCEEYDKALALVNDAYDIMYSLFGENDPDTLNVSSSKSSIYYYMGRYQEALEIGLKNLETYTKFNGELNYLRFEQLALVYKCYNKLGDVEKVNSMRENVLKIGEQLLAEDSKQLKELKEI